MAMNKNLSNYDYEQQEKIIKEQLNDHIKESNSDYFGCHGDKIIIDFLIKKIVVLELKVNRLEENK